MESVQCSGGSICVAVPDVRHLLPTHDCVFVYAYILAHPIDPASRTVASQAMEYWDTCPLDFQQLHFSSLWSKSNSQPSKYCVVCEISWCRCQQLTALSISTAVVTKLLVIEQLLHPALKSTVSAPWPTFQLCPSCQQILATPLFQNISVKQLLRSASGAWVLSLYQFNILLTECVNWQPHMRKRKLWGYQIIRLRGPEAV